MQYNSTRKLSNCAVCFYSLCQVKIFRLSMKKHKSITTHSHRHVVTLMLFQDPLKKSQTSPLKIKLLFISFSKALLRTWSRLLPGSPACPLSVFMCLSRPDTDSSSVVVIVPFSGDTSGDVASSSFWTLVWRRPSLLSLWTSSPSVAMGTMSSLDFSVLKVGSSLPCSTSTSAAAVGSELDAAIVCQSIDVDSTRQQTLYTHKNTSAGE